MHLIDLIAAEAILPFTLKHSMPKIEKNALEEVIIILFINIELLAVARCQSTLCQTGTIGGPKID